MRKRKQNKLMVKALVLSYGPDRRKMERYIRKGWVVVGEQRRQFFRGCTYTFARADSDLAKGFVNHG